MAFDLMEEMTLDKVERTTMIHVSSPKLPK